MMRHHAEASDEDAYLTGLIEAAHLGGWLVHHDRRSDRAITQGRPGFPDILAAHPGRGLVVAWEVKDRGHSTPDQAAWLGALRAGGVDARVIRPDAYPMAIELLLGSAAQSRPRRVIRPR
jgi:hypothetical protein